MKWILMILAAAGVSFAGPSFAKEKSRSGRKVASETSPESAFKDLFRIATHNRCTNCHTASEVPMQGEFGLPHSFLISRNIKTLGYSCTSCHASSGENISPLPPRALHWDMPAAKKALPKSITPAQLCALWKDPSSNFFESGERIGLGRSLEDLVEHVENDALVQWSFAPGVGRVAAPGTHAEFVAKFKEWVDGGAPCPL